MEDFYREPTGYGARRANELDQSTLIGAAAAFGLVFLAIFLGGGLASFFEFQSLLIVIGGTLGGTLINFPLDDFKRSIAALRTVFFPDYSSATLRMKRLVELSKKSRAAGLLTLQEDIYRESDSFLRKSLELAVDDLHPDDIRRTLEIEIAFLEDRHRRAAQLFQSMGTLAPAMGLIGTLIGLVQMLRTIEDPSTIGPAMSVALLTTFYGAMLANLIFLPLAGKLRTRSEAERLIKEMTLEGIIDIVYGTNPRLVEQRLLSFLPPEERRSQFN